MQVGIGSHSVRVHAETIFLLFIYIYIYIYLFIYLYKTILIRYFAFLDIDDCAGKPCLNEGKCVDEVNSYRCDCKSGFEGKSCEISKLMHGKFISNT